MHQSESLAYYEQPNYKRIDLNFIVKKSVIGLSYLSINSFLIVLPLKIEAKCIEIGIFSNDHFGRDFLTDYIILVRLTSQ